MGLRSAGAWLGLVESGEDGLRDDEYLEDLSDEEPGESPDPDGVQGSGFQIAMVRPRNFRDATTIGEYYRQDIPVFINLEDLTDADAKRIVDFACGLILGRRGDIERLARRIFVIVPPGTTIHVAQDRLAQESFFNQA